MVMATGLPQGQRVNPRFTLEVTPGMSIANAIANADALGGEWTILVYPGTYDEGDITPTGGADITIKGMGEGRVEIAPTAVPAAGVIVSGGTLNLEDIIVTAPTAAMPPLRVTGGNCTLTRCILTGVGLGDAIQQVEGSLRIDSCCVTAGFLDITPTDACTLSIEGGDYNGTFIMNAGAHAHQIHIRHSDWNGYNWILDGSGATFDFDSNNDIGDVTDNSLIGVNCRMSRCDVTGTFSKSGTTPWVIDNSQIVLLSNTNATGGIILWWGTCFGIASAVGSIVWYLDNNTLKVIPSTTITDTIIQWAVNAAGAGDTILLYPGTYQEAVTLAAGIDLKGVGPASSVIIYQLNADVITLADNVHIDNLTVRLGTPDAERHLIEDNAVACTARMTNLIMEIVAPTNIANLMVFYFTGAGDYTIERCSFNITYTGAAVGHGVHTSTNAATLHLVNNDFTYLVNASAIHVFSAIASTITGGGNRWAGTAHLFGVTLGTITLDKETVVCTGMVEGDVTAGTVLLRIGENTYEVFPGMQIQHALTAGAGGEVIIRPGAFAPTANLTVTATTTVRGSGKDVTIIAPTGDAITNGIILNGNDITLRDMKVDLAAGAGVGTARPNCIYADTRTGLLLQNLILFGDETVGDDGSDDRQNGIFFDACDYSDILQNLCQDNVRHGIRIANAVNELKVIGNTCRSNQGNGIYHHAGDDSIIADNLCQNNSSAGIYLNNTSDENTISGNICRANLWGIHIYNICASNTITGNVCHDNTREGIRVRTGCELNSITGNACSKNDKEGNTYCGIAIEESDKNTIVGNTCDQNGLHGIFIFRSDYNALSGNGAHDNYTGDGINVEGDATDNADYNSLVGNTCTGNADDGIAIEGGANANKNIVTSCQLLGNTGTPLVDNGTNTEVGHNITV